MGDALRGFVEWFAERIRGQPDNDALLRYVRKNGVRDASVLERLGARELCEPHPVHECETAS